MKFVCVSRLFLCAFAAFAQTQQSKSPVEILYGPPEAGSKDSWPVISGIMNTRATFEGQPAYPKKAKELHVEGRVEVQLLVNEDGEVVFTNPLSGPEALWAAAVKIAVSAQFKPLKVEGKPRKITGRLIFDFKNGKVELPYSDGFTD